MITISLCMIVKNEAAVLRRCLDSVADLVDEIIIVDTGSEDDTKEIAGQYTRFVYDFKWVDDFSAARNFACSKATKEYIYSADADEVLNEENRERFRILKETLLPEIEVVQMKYANQLKYRTVYNYDEEYRPKLYKRIREFVWEAPIHENIRMMPIVFDSDIVIDHLPEVSHAGRDLAAFRRQIQKGYRLPKRLHNMYARELLMAGEKEDLTAAIPFFVESAADSTRDNEEIEEACCVVARAARINADAFLFHKYTAKVIAGTGNSEVCYELGAFYEEQEDFIEAAVWYYNAVYETQPILNLRAAGEDSLEGLIRCYQKLGWEEQVQFYQKELRERQKAVKQKSELTEKLS